MLWKPNDVNVAQLLFGPSLPQCNRWLRYWRGMLWMEISRRLRNRPASRTKAHAARCAPTTLKPNRWETESNAKSISTYFNCLFAEAFKTMSLSLFLQHENAPSSTQCGIKDWDAARSLTEAPQPHGQMNCSNSYVLPLVAHDFSATCFANNAYPSMP